MNNVSEQENPLKNKVAPIRIDEELVSEINAFRERDHRPSFANAANALIARGLAYERQQAHQNPGV